VTISGSPGQNGYFGSGQIDLIGTGANAGEILATWCIDVFDDLQGSDNYNVALTGFTNNGGNGGTLLGSTTLSAIGELVNWGDTNINASIYNSAAVQLAIWTVEYPGATFTSDSSNVNSLVGTLVTEADDDSLGPSALLKEVVDPGENQGLVFEVGTNGSLANAPLPSTWTMMLAGLLSFGLFAYRGSRAIRLTNIPSGAAFADELFGDGQALNYPQR
jgi:hypothetical protein